MILSGQTNGSSATVAVIPIGGGRPAIDPSPETFFLGVPFGPFPQICPIEE